MTALVKKNSGFAQFLVLLVFAVLAIAIPVTTNLVTQRQNLGGRAGNGPYPTAITPTAIPTSVPCTCVNHVMVGGCDNLILGKPCNITPTPSPCVCVNHVMVGGCDTLILGKPCDITPTPVPACTQGESQCSGSRLQTCVCSAGVCSWHSQNCVIGCNETLKRCVDFIEPTPTVPPPDPACAGKTSGDCCGGSAVCSTTSVGKLICNPCASGRTCQAGQGCVLLPTPSPTLVPPSNYRCSGNNLMQGNQIIETCSYGCDSTTNECKSAPIPTPTTASLLGFECLTAANCEASGRCNVACSGLPLKCSWQPCVTPVLSPTPVPSVYRCSGNNLMQGNQVIDTCSYGCDSAALQCRLAPANCGSYTNGSSRCNNGSSAYEICDNGSWLARTCPSGKTCQDGFCRQPEIVQTCRPGGTTCEGNDVYTCKLDGSDYERSRNCAWGCSEGSCMGLGEIVDDVTGGDPQALNFALTASGMQAAPLITNTLQTAGQVASPYVSSAFSSATNTLAQAAYTYGPTVFKAGMVTGTISSVLSGIGMVGQGIAGSYETITGNTTNNTINDIDYYSNLSGQGGGVLASLSTGLLVSGNMLTTIGENYASTVGEGANSLFGKPNSATDFIGGKRSKLIVDVNKDPLLRESLQRGVRAVKAEVSQQPPSYSDGTDDIIRAALRYTQQEIRYDTARGIEKNYAQSPSMALYQAGGGTAYLGDFCDLGTGVCKEQAAYLHVLLGELGVETKYVFGTVGSNQGGHAWVEKILGGRTWVLDATNNWFKPANAYNAYQGGAGSFKTFNFLR